MKKINALVVLFIITCVNFVNAQNVNIPDANFKAALVGNPAINFNLDGEIQFSEATIYAGTINVTSLSITNLTGIEAFTTITGLNCSYNSLTTLNVSSNSLLTSLNCGMNNISALNLTNNTSLTFLNADYNNLSSINLSTNTALTYINVGGNNITSIDLSNNISAVTLYLGNNLLSTLDLSNNLSVTFLDCGYNSQLTSLNIVSNIAITSLLCSNSNLSILNIQNGNNSNLTTFNAINNPNLKCILVDDPIFMNTNWPSAKDAGANYNTDCNASWCNTTFICSITVNSLPVIDGEIYLFKQNNLNSRMDTIVFATMSSSTYTFDEMFSGKYIVYYKPNLSTHPNTPGTYNGNVTDWSTGIISTTTCNTSYTININATSFATFTGPGTISGQITEGSNFGKTNGLGDPIPGVDISLEQNPGGIMVAQTVTDSNGDFTFTNLPEDNYRVKVNIPGTPHTSYHDVSINASNTTISNLEYIVDSTQIYHTSTVGNIDKTDTNNSLALIPNPFDKEALLILSNEWRITNQEIVIAITDISGKVVYTKKYNSNYEVIINRENLENGMYFIKIESVNKSTIKKIIITD